MRTSLDPRSVLCQFPVTEILVPQLYTRRPVCSHLTMTHHFNATRAKVSCARVQTGIRASSFFILLFWSRLRDTGIVWNLRLRQVILALIWSPHVVSPCETHLIACTCSIRLRRDFWWSDWRIVVGSVDTCVLWSERANGVQHSNLNDDGSSDESSYGRVDGTSGANRKSFDR